MDELDYRIVDQLQREGRATQLEISRAVGLSQPAVAERIRKLEERGVITGYAARVDAAQLGKDITAFIGVSIEHPKFFEGFAKKVLALPEVLECHRVAGQDSYLLKVQHGEHPDARQPARGDAAAPSPASPGPTPPSSSPPSRRRRTSTSSQRAADRSPPMTAMTSLSAPAGVSRSPSACRG